MGVAVLKASIYALEELEGLREGYLGLVKASLSFVAVAVWGIWRSMVYTNLSQILYLGL